MYIKSCKIYGKHIFSKKLVCSMNSHPKHIINVKSYRISRFIYVMGNLLIVCLSTFLASPYGFCIYFQICFTLYQYNHDSRVS